MSEKNKSTTLDQNYGDYMSVLDGGDTNTRPEGKRDDSGLVALLNMWFEQAKDAREPQETRWRKNEELYTNNIDMKRYPVQTVLKFNIPLAVVQTIAPIMNDYLPTYDVLPEKSNDQAFADMMQKRCEQAQIQAKSRSVDMDVIEDSLVYSNGLKEIIPEIDENGIMTGIRERVVDPFTWYPAPHSTGMDIKTEARYHIFATPMHIDEIEYQYGIRLSGEGDLDEQRAFSEIQDRKEGDDDHGEYTLVKVCYFMDGDADEYPNGRMVTWAEDQILADNPIPYYRIPYFMVKNYGDAHSIYGVGEPELVAHSTAAINYGLSNIYDNISEFGNPIRRIKHSLWNRFKNMMTRRRRTIIVDQPEDITYLQPPAINQTTFSAIELTMRLTDIVTGVHDVMEGRKPGGITAASAITALQEAAQARVRYKITKEIRKYVQEYGEFTVALLKEYDTEIREIRVRDQASGSFNFVEYNPNARVDSNGNLLDNPQDGVVEDPETFRSFSDTNFDVQVTTGFREPTGRAHVKEEAFEKFKVGIYGIEDYVMAANEPNKEDIIQRFYQRQGIDQAMNIFGELQEIAGAADNMAPEDWPTSPEHKRLFEILGELKGGGEQAPQ